MAETYQIFNKSEPEDLLKVDASLNTLDKSLLKFSEDINKLSAKLKEQNISFTQLVEVQKQVETGSSKLDAATKQTITTAQKLNDIQKGRYNQAIKNNQAIQQETAAIKQNTIIVEAQKGAYNKINAELNKNIAAWKNLSAEERINSTVGRQLLTTIQRQDAELKKLDAQIGRSQRNVGNYGSALMGVGKSLLGAFGVVGGTAMFAKVMTDAFNNIRTFTKENAILAGVLGKERVEIEQLTKQSILLGAVYPVTSTEVVKLQTSYAKLGFTQSEILNLTEATVLGSMAMNSSLDDTATLVGSIVKAYDNLRSSDATLIMDQITQATQMSSMSFESLETSLPKVAGAANALNIPLSKTLALLGIAQDATLDASIAGTSLKNIFIETAKRGITLEDALNQVRGSTNKLKTAYDLFGQRAAIVGLALANNTDTIRDYDEAIKESGGITEKVAKTQMATLDGAIKELGGAWEKTILGFRESEGFLRSFISGIADRLNVATDSYASFFDKLRTGIVSIASMALPLEKILGLDKDITKKRDIRMELLAFIQTASQDEINIELKKHTKLLDGNKKFNDAVQVAIKNRQEQIAIQDKEDKTLALKKEQEFELEKFSLQDRITDLFVSKQQEEIKSVMDKYAEMIIEAKKYGLDISDIERKRDQEIAKIKADAGKKESDRIKKENDDKLRIERDQDKVLEKENEDMQKELEKSINERLDWEIDQEDSKNQRIIDGNIEAGKLNIESIMNDKQRQYEMEVAIIDATAKNETEKREKIHALNQKSIDEEMQGALDMLQFMELSAEDEIYWIEKIKALKHEAELNERDDAKQTADEKKRLRQEIADQAINVVGALFEFSISKTQGELQALEDKNKKGLISDKEYAKQKSALELKEAKQQRTKALFEIAVNTATSIVKVFPNFILMALAGALGAIQAATVLSKPLPEALAKGSKDAPRKFIAGEAGRELVALKSGQILMADRATYFEGDKFKGATVFSNPETEKIMSRTNHSGYGPVHFSDNRIVNGITELNRTIKKKPVAIFQDGNMVGWQNDTHKEIYYNRLRNG